MDITPRLSDMTRMVLGIIERRLSPDKVTLRFKGDHGTRFYLERLLREGEDEDGGMYFDAVYSTWEVKAGGEQGRVLKRVASRLGLEKGYRFDTYTSGCFCSINDKDGGFEAYLTISKNVARLHVFGTPKEIGRFYTVLNDVCDNGRRLDLNGLNMLRGDRAVAPMYSD